MIHVHHVDATTIARWAPGLRALERDISYPIADGADRFRIDHGPDYHRFFSTLGEAHFLVAVDGERVVGSVAGILRRAEWGGRTFTTAYACDYKVAADHRGAGLASRMLLRGLAEILSPLNPPRYRSFRFVYGAAMRGAKGDVLRSARGALNPLRLVSPAARLALYFVEPTALARLEPAGCPADVPPGGLDLSPDVATTAEGSGIVSTAGRKDYVLESTRAPWTLVHLPLGPSAWRPTLAHHLRVGGEVLAARGDRGPVCFALDERLTEHGAWLRERGLTPGATATIVAWKLPFSGRDVPEPRDYPWIHLATSEI